MFLAKKERSKVLKWLKFFKVCFSTQFFLNILYSDLPFLKLRQVQCFTQTYRKGFNGCINIILKTGLTAKEAALPKNRLV